MTWDDRKRRAPLRRHVRLNPGDKPLKPGKGPRRRSGRLPAVSRRSADGKPKRFRERRDYALQDYVRRLPCVLAGHPLHRCRFWGDRLGIECAHVLKRSAGEYDRDGCFGACPGLHEEQEGRGNTARAEAKYGVSFRAIAEGITAAYDRGDDPETVADWLVRRWAA